MQAPLFAVGSKTSAVAPKRLLPVWERRPSIPMASDDRASLRFAPSGRELPFGQVEHLVEHHAHDGHGHDA